jgi:hypothetical protein
MTKTNLALAVLAICTTALFGATVSSDFESLIGRIVAQLDQQSQSDQRLIDQTLKLRRSIQTAENNLAGNRVAPARQQVLEREALIAVNEMIANPKRTKIQLDSFLRRAHEGEESILRRAVDGPAATRLETTRLSAQIKARKAVFADLRRDVEILKKFPTAQERIEFLKNNVELIWQVVRERSGANVTQP